MHGKIQSKINLILRCATIGKLILAMLKTDAQAMNASQIDAQQMIALFVQTPTQTRINMFV